MPEGGAGSEKRGVIRKAFLLGAGLGTRLRPLTDRLPKPLVPLFHRPLVEWAMEACAGAGIERFAINTHHLPHRWHEPREGWEERESTGWPGENEVASREAAWRGLPVSFFHEPELLDTGGGIRNVGRWAGGDDVLVHNGDIFSTLPLGRLIEAHEASGDVVTLALRSAGPPAQVRLEGDRVGDLRNSLGRGPGTHGFTGIYCFSPELIGRIGGGKVSVIPAFLALAEEGRIGGVVLDEGEWLDLGDPESYLRAHRELSLAEPVHARASVSPGARVGHSVIGPGAVVEDGAEVLDSVLWPGARVRSGERVAGEVRVAGW